MQKITNKQVLGLADFFATDENMYPLEKCIDNSEPAVEMHCMQ
jgi:hypothetical protein